MSGQGADRPTQRGVTPFSRNSDWIQRALQQAKVLVYSCDIASGIVQRSENSMEIVGLPSTGRSDRWSDSIFPEDLPYFENALKSISPEAPEFEVEYRFRHAVTNAWFWVLDRGEGQFDDSGNRLYVHGAITDISRRVDVETGMREAAARHAAIVASSEDAIISTDPSGIVTSWNAGARRLLGYPAEEMIGHSLFRIIPPDYASQETAVLNSVKSGQSVTPYDSVRLRRDNSRLDVSLTVSPIYDASGRVTGASSIIRDITERRHHIEELRLNEQRLSLALKGARAGAWVYDIQRREMRWSPEMFILYGLDPESDTPPRGHFASQVAAAHKSRVQAEFTEAIARGGTFNLEFPIVRPDGTEIWTAVMGDVIEDASGMPVSAHGIDQDITERKSWEKRQAMMLRELSHRVKNTMAVIQSMTRQTLRVSRDPKIFADAFEGRIRSLASSHNLLTDAEWRGANLSDVIASQLGGMVDSMAKRFRLRGPDVVLPPEAATQLGLVLHELGTNAAKYGALTTPVGQIAIVWRVSSSKLRLTWRERGGPRIEVPPSHIGFGTSLIDSSAANVERRFDPAGLTCKLELAL